MNSLTILVFCGEGDRIQTVVDRLSKIRASDTLWTGILLPCLEAAKHLKQDQPSEAVQALQASIRYERTRPEPIYLRGLAYMRARKGPEAAAEFKKIVNHRGAYWGQLLALAHLGLGQANAIAGDTAVAKRAYQDFFALWKDADPDLPVLIAARKEYAALK